MKSRIFELSRTLQIGNLQSVTVTFCDVSDTVDLHIIVSLMLQIDTLLSYWDCRLTLCGVFDTAD